LFNPCFLFWTVVFEEDKVDEQVEESEEDGKFLMLRIAISPFM